MATPIIPTLIDNDPVVILAQMKARYEEITGKVLPAGSPEMGILNTFAYRESLLRGQIQSAGLQMLVAFSTAPVLDFLGELVGVIRLSPGFALCTLTLTLTSGHTDTIIPAGTRIQSKDGTATFETEADIFVPSGTLTVTQSAIAQTAGIAGNGYASGEISVILDPHPFLETAENNAVTVAGSDAESDEQLRDRIRLAPASFSVAGPTDAYKFFTFSASPLIIDVAVTQPVPGTVNVYPLVSGPDPTPTEILNLVIAELSDEKKRPLSDTVNVLAPTKVTYSLVVHLTTITGTVNQDAIDAVTAAIQAFTQLQSNKMARDIIGTKVKSICMGAMPDGLYDVALVSFTDIIIGETEYGFCNSLTVSVTGSNGG